MAETTQMSHVSSRIDELLSQVTESPMLATALLDALVTHVDHKTQTLKQRVHTFESKWQMNFDEFSAQVSAGKVTKFVSLHDAKQDLLVWEQTLTLLRHYQSLQVW